MNHFNDNALIVMRYQSYTKLLTIHAESRVRITVELSQSSTYWEHGNDNFVNVIIDDEGSQQQNIAGIEGILIIRDAVWCGKCCTH